MSENKSAAQLLREAQRALAEAHAEAEKLAFMLRVQIGIYRSAEQDVTDSRTYPVGSIVAYRSGTPWIKRSDGWYVGDTKQPDAFDCDFSGATVLRRGWTG